MDYSNIITAVATTATLATVLQAKNLYAWAKKSLAERSAATMSLAENVQSANALLEGTIKACESIAASTVQLNQTVTAMSKLIMASNPATGSQGIPSVDDAGIFPDQDKDFIMGSVIEKVLAGKSFEQAQAEAINEEEKKTQYSAVSMGLAD
jgi:hypothetical protein